MKIYSFFNWVIIGLLVLTTSSYAAESDVDRLIDLLIEKKVVTFEDATGFKADLALKKQEEKESQKDFIIIVGNPIRISGYTQGRYIADKTKSETFDIRRVRLDIRGDITERFDYRTQFEFGGDYKNKAAVTSVTSTTVTTEDEDGDLKTDKVVSKVTPKTSDFPTSGTLLLDAILGFKVNSSLRINVGQFFIPFSQENLNSNTKLETINRSQVIEALAARGKDVIGNQNGRDVGIQAGGNIFQEDGLSLIDYAFGVFNGSGTNKPDLNDRKDLVGRLVFHPVKELSVGGSYYNGSYTLSSDLTKKKTRIRSGAEIAFVKDDISIKGEYINGKDDTINKDGWYIQTGYFFIPKTFQGVLKYDSYDPNTNGRDKDLKDETSVYTYGVNWYFNKWAFIQVNYEQKNEKAANIENNVFTGQVTLQF